MDLKSQKCVPCEGSVMPFKGEEIEKHLAELKGGWLVVGDKKITKRFTFKNFKEAISFINKVAEIAEDEGHHPDINLSWNKVDIILWTHAIGGLSLNDFILAAKIEEIK